MIEILSLSERLLLLTLVEELNKMNLKLCQKN